MAINITFLADMASFLKGAQEGGVALEDIIDSLDEVRNTAAQAGDRAGDAIGDGLDDAARTGGRALGRLDDDIEATQRTAENAMRDTERQAERTGDSVADDLGDGFEKAGDDAGSMRDNAIGSIGDIVSEAASGGDSIGESLAGGFEAAASVIPGVGGLIGAAIGSIATSAFSAWEESAKQTEERTRDMYTDMIASGQEYLSYKYLEAEITRLWEEDTEGLNRRAELLGVDASLLAVALAGEASALDEVTSIANDHLDKTIQQVAALRAGDQPLFNLGNEQNDLQNLVNELNGVAQSTDNAIVGADGLRESLERMNEINPSLKLEADTEQAEADLDAAAIDRSTTIQAQADTTIASRDLTSFVGATRTATVEVEVSTGYAAGILNDFINRRRSVDVTLNTVDREGRQVP